MKKNTVPKKMAILRNINGQIVLNDPQALVVINAVNKKNCEVTFKLQLDRINHFKNRMLATKAQPEEVIIVLINADDIYGQPIADLLMPGHNWQAIRDKNEIPFARGLAKRDKMQELVELFDKEASSKLKESPEKIAVMIVDHNVAEIFFV